MGTLTRPVPMMRIDPVDILLKEFAPHAVRHPLSAMHAGFGRELSGGSGVLVCDRAESGKGRWIGRRTAAPDMIWRQIFGPGVKLTAAGPIFFMTDKLFAVRKM